MAIPSRPIRSLRERTLRGGRPVTATKVTPARRASWIAALVRAETVRSLRSKVPSRSLATTRITRASSPPQPPAATRPASRRHGRPYCLPAPSAACGRLACLPPRFAAHQRYRLEIRWPVESRHGMLTCSVRIYWVLLRAGFRRQAVYRLALVSGLVTNAFFGVIRTSVFTALYRQRPEVSGLTRSDILTYIWLLEGMFAVIWASWIWEFASSVRSGDFAGGAAAPVRDDGLLDARLQGRAQPAGPRALPGLWLRHPDRLLPRATAGGGGGEPAVRADDGAGPGGRRPVRGHGAGGSGRLAHGARRGKHGAAGEPLRLHRRLAHPGDHRARRAGLHRTGARAGGRQQAAARRRLAADPKGHLRPGADQADLAAGVHGHRLCRDPSAGAIPGGSRPAGVGGARRGDRLDPGAPGRGGHGDRLLRGGGLLGAGARRGAHLLHAAGQRGGQRRPGRRRLPDRLPDGALRVRAASRVHLGIPVRPGGLRAGPDVARPQWASGTRQRPAMGRAARQRLAGRDRLARLAARHPPLRRSRLVSTGPIIEVAELRKDFRTRRGPVTAVAGVI